MKSTAWDFLGESLRWYELGCKSRVSACGFSLSGSYFPSSAEHQGGFVFCLFSVPVLRESRELFSRCSLLGPQLYGKSNLLGTSPYTGPFNTWAHKEENHSLSLLVLINTSGLKLFQCCDHLSEFSPLFGFCLKISYHPICSLMLLIRFKPFYLAF